MLLYLVLMSISRDIRQIYLLYYSRILLVLCSLGSSVALFSAPDLLLVEPHCYEVRHAVNSESARISLLRDFTNIHSPSDHV